MYSKIQSKGLPQQIATPLLTTAKEKGRETEINQLLNQYKSGVIHVKLVPVEGTYCYQYTDANGNDLLPGTLIPTPYTEIPNQGVAEILNTPKKVTDNAIHDLIYTILND